MAFNFGLSYRLLIVLPRFSLNVAVTYFLLIQFVFDEDTCSIDNYSYFNNVVEVITDFLSYHNNKHRWLNLLAEF